jgi:hypothetical protein
MNRRLSNGGNLLSSRGTSPIHEDLINRRERRDRRVGRHERLIDHPDPERPPDLLRLGRGRGEPEDCNQSEADVARDVAVRHSATY